MLKILITTLMAIVLISPNAFCDKNYERSSDETIFKADIQLYPWLKELNYVEKMDYLNERRMAVLNTVTYKGKIKKELKHVEILRTALYKKADLIKAGRWPQD